MSSKWRCHWLVSCVICKTSTASLVCLQEVIEFRRFVLLCPDCCETARVAIKHRLCQRVRPCGIPSSRKISEVSLCLNNMARLKVWNVELFQRWSDEEMKRWDARQSLNGILFGRNSPACTLLSSSLLCVASHDCYYDVSLFSLSISCHSIAARFQTSRTSIEAMERKVELTEAIVDLCKASSWMRQISLGKCCPYNISAISFTSSSSSFSQSFFDVCITVFPKNSVTQALKFCPFFQLENATLLLLGIMGSQKIVIIFKGGSKGMTYLL